MVSLHVVYVHTTIVGPVWCILEGTAFEVLALIDCTKVHSSKVCTDLLVAPSFWRYLCVCSLPDPAMYIHTS